MYWIGRGFVFFLMMAIVAHCQAADRVFLLGGQSNMVGKGETAQLTGPLSAPQPDVYFWSDGWVPLAPGYGRRSHNFGPEISFGRALKDALPDDNIYLVKYAASATALYDDWRPTDGPQYIEFIAIARAALEDLEARGVDYEISGMLWMQGESDAKENQAMAYEANLRNFIAHMREAFAAPDMPFIIARVLNYFGGESGQAEIVRNTQVRVAETTHRVTWFDTDGYQTVDPVEDPGHYGTQGLLDLGADFAGSMLEYLPKAGRWCLREPDQFAR